MDCAFCLRACRDHEKAFEPRFEYLHNSTDFEHNTVRETPVAASTYGNRLQRGNA